MRTFATIDGENCCAAYDDAVRVTEAVLPTDEPVRDTPPPSPKSLLAVRDSAPRGVTPPPPPPPPREEGARESGERSGRNSQKSAYH